MTRDEKIRKKIGDALRLIRHSDLKTEMALTRAFNDGLRLGIELQTIEDDPPVTGADGLRFLEEALFKKGSE